MRRVISIVLLGLAITWAAALIAADGLPLWAYGYTTAPDPGAVVALPPAQVVYPDQSPKRLPGSTRAFTRAQIRDAFGPADWFPDAHPAMPDIVARGRKPEVWACGLCHYPNGKGRPENARVSGLPVAYFIQQMADFKDGLRQSADPKKANTKLMGVLPAR